MRMLAKLPAPKINRTRLIRNRAVSTKKAMTKARQRTRKNARFQRPRARQIAQRNLSSDRGDNNSRRGGRENGEKSDSQFKSNNSSMDGPTAAKHQSSGKIIQTIKGKNDSVSVAIKSDKTSHAATLGEVTVVTTTEAADPRVDVKNSPEFINGSVSPPCVVSAPNTSDGTASEGAADMFSDNGEQNWQENAPLDGNSEWSENDVLPGQILQAINTSLTNRHKMRDRPEENDILADADERMNSRQEGIHEKDEMVSSKALPVNDCVAINSCDVTTEKLEKSNEEELTESTMNVEPRASFLHGIVSGNKASKPNAIYGPASDLFVSRSNSSSSSSSDEMSKSQVSLSINVIVNGGDNSEHSVDIGNPYDEENENADMMHEETTAERPVTSTTASRTKPRIPAKPSKKSQQKDNDNENYSKAKFKDDKLNLVNDRKSESIIQERTYYTSTTGDSPRSITLIDHYAESNIYHEVNEKDTKIQSAEQTEKSLPAREYKLAALAIELEQVRHSNGTKRQAPAPPKIPDPPLEDPPSCAGRTSPSVGDAPHGFSTFRGESMAFSSASSTTSTSSQDTETGYASWNLQGDMDDHPKYSKSKSSFLLTQYSKCKMLAMGYAEDSARARKKFSLKKLLKIGKESETPVNFDPSSPNPKAWKYSDHFERPRAKLEIIHPMDLENKSVTVNPGFDSLHSGSMSSFTASADDLSFRNSVSSDYGSYYSDTMSPAQDLKQEANYEYIQPRQPSTDEQEDSSSRNGGSNSPTPSRCSLASQASTLTSGSSKNGATPPHRPPKPPPPPRAHSLLPGNKAFRNSDGTFKFPVINDEALNGEEVRSLPPKPQAPKRQCKSAILRSDYANFDEQKTETIQEFDDITPTNENISEKEDDGDEKFEGKVYESSTIVQIGSSENHENIYSDISIKAEIEEKSEEKDVVIISKEASNSTAQNAEEDFSLKGTPQSVEEGESDDSTSGIAEAESKTETSISIKTTATVQKDKLSKSMLSRNKHPPITKSPARPPPIYSKPQTGNFSKSTVPWKTLEDSYLALTLSNRELLIKLVNKALNEQKAFLAKLQKMKFQWSDFEIDANQPSSVFAFGEKIAYHATMPTNPEYSVTLVITIQQQQNRLNESSDLKYPVFGQFTDYVPSELLDGSSDGELESMQATVLVLDHSNISTIECFTESLSESLTEENEKELCFIILQLIQSLKSLQAQGIETMDTSFQNLILAKSRKDKFHTLVFLSDNCYDECDYSSDACKISLCQYALMLLLQMLKVQSVDEFPSMSATKFASLMAKKVFKAAISLLSEEKAVSLSQTKTLLECFLWGITKVLECPDYSDDMDNMLHRWLDIERSNFIKYIITNENSNINTQNEYYSQFLIRTSVRNIREVASYL